MIGVSACLAGESCTFRGGHHVLSKIKEMVENEKAVMICPEVLAGLSIPRDPCEIRNGKVYSNQGKEETKAYYHGAYKALEILKEKHIKVVLLKSKSPSCGQGKIYDGSFNHTLIDGDGIAVQVFKKHGIRVFNENELETFFEYLEKELK